jgi:hypothetical protein
MKKITILLTTLLLITSCSESEVTDKNQDMQMIQHKNPGSTAYRVDNWNYIVCDSSNVYHVTVTGGGKIHTKIKIK